MPRFTSSIAIACVLLAACSQSPQDRENSTVSSNDAAPAAAMREEAGSGGMAPPGISPHAAPGVAFNYAYSFVLPSKAISAVQESHAAACEKLGIARCRITGMRYSLTDEDSVSAQLTFKLDPALARAFGKEGIASWSMRRSPARMSARRSPHRSAAAPMPRQNFPASRRASPPAALPTASAPN
jgi:hypothetical protein